MYELKFNDICIAIIMERNKDIFSGPSHEKQEDAKVWPIGHIVDV